MIESLYYFSYTPRLLFFMHSDTWFDWFVLIWRLVRRKTVYIWCDIYISCISALPACEPFHCGIFHGRSFSHVSLGLIVSQWLKPCVWLTYVLCITHVCLVYDSCMTHTFLYFSTETWFQSYYLGVSRWWRGCKEIHSSHWYSSRRHHGYIR